MIQKPEEFDSAFRYIVVVSQRAEQIINGAKPRGESRHVKPTLIARDDVDQGLVAWRILTQEELDAQRQAIVEQFRAEVGGEATAEPSRHIPDVLPTSVPFSGLDDETYEGDQDDELDRLQRLLGMAARAGRSAEPRAAGSADEAVDAGDEEEDEDAADDDAEAIDDIGEIQDGDENETPLDDEPEALDDEDDDE
jgi:DNA-directed RNA polymerase subunit K/omega